jgi:GTP pyrophosphokinase
MAKLLSSYTESEEEDKKVILRAYRSLLRSTGDHVTKSDKKRIRQAFEVSAEAHKHMRRKSGEPYILHPIAVAKIAATEMYLGATSIICALLHDTVEDTEMTLDDIQFDFGNTAREIIDGLTKISTVASGQDTSLQAENFRKILLTLADDPRVILIKIADRLHNMRTLQSMRKDKQLKIASETSFIYAPIAHRLGLYDIKSELEDLSLRYSQPEIYFDLKDKLANTKKERNKYIREFIKPIKEELNLSGFDFEIAGRSKSIHSIWNKMVNKNVSFEEVFDLFAIRIIIDSNEANEKSDCWKVFSIITALYHQNSERMRDWLSAPKSNGYEALHTTVMSPKGKWVEVQIRSKRMNEIAEKGLAAHWRYKEGTDKGDSKIDLWLKNIRETLKDPDKNALELISDIKTDLFKDEIFCYSPKGKVITMPKGATALDFAFEIHSELGKTCIGAKVNYKLVPISQEIKNGDQIEIITSSKQKPSSDWLSFVKTGKAKSRIKYYLNEEKRKVAEDGKVALQRKLKTQSIELTDHNAMVIMNYLNYDSHTDMYFAMAQQSFDFKILKSFENKTGHLVAPKKSTDPKRTQKKTKDETQLKKKISSKEFELVLFGSESSDRIHYTLANCCKPIQGDDVFGFVTTGEGMKIHTNNCPNAASLLAQYSHRVVKAKWANNKDISFLTTLRVTGIDDVGIINNITNIISGELKINMRSMSIESTEGLFEGKIKVFVKEKKELKKLIDKLERVSGIHKVKRIEEAQ